MPEAVAAVGPATVESAGPAAAESRRSEGAPATGPESGITVPGSPARGSGFPVPS